MNKQVLQRLGIRVLISQTRLYLNRPAFVAAIKQSPAAPSRSRYGASFAATYISAQELVQLLEQLVKHRPIVARNWSVAGRTCEDRFLICKVVFLVPCLFIGSVLVSQPAKRPPRLEILLSTERADLRSQSSPLLARLPVLRSQN